MVKIIKYIEIIFISHIYGLYTVHMVGERVRFLCTGRERLQTKQVETYPGSRGLFFLSPSQ
jgi:hypothetical protein